ncbi:MAG: hypothetical protein J7M19_10115, partial [Planctomycetes bacterium]|nr:hypothetical protein [Planctomycetota bacterium]
QAARWTSWKSANAGWRTELPEDSLYTLLKQSQEAGGQGGAALHTIAGPRAFLMENDELYCDVIVHRREQFTVRNAEKKGTG